MVNWLIREIYSH